MAFDVGAGQVGQFVHCETRSLWMDIRKIAGLVLVVAGLGIVYTGYQISGTLGNQIGEALKGSPTDSVTLRYVTGAVFVAAGAFLAK